MAEILELFHFLEQHRMPEMEIGRGGIEAGFDLKRLSALEFFYQLIFEQNLDRAAAQQLDLLAGVLHASSRFQGTRMRRISRALPEFSSTSATTPCRTTFSFATSNFRGRPDIKPSITRSFSIPITESSGPHMPRSVMSAVPPGRILPSAACTCVCVPKTTEARPSRNQPMAIFSEVASACMSTITTRE